jgi:hypothetical protein
VLNGAARGGCEALARHFSFFHPVNFSSTADPAKEIVSSLLSGLIGGAKTDDAVPIGFCA